jgi:hypothetical protein
MACCLIAAFLIAQAIATLHRWGMFWGLVAIPEGETVDTAFSTARAFLARPQVRRTVTAAVCVELAVLGMWTYTEHGTHIYQLADQAAARLRGEQVIYAGVCTPGTKRRVRIVLADRSPAFSHFPRPQ